MKCDLPGRQNLEWHIKPKLDRPEPKGDGTGYHAHAPCHEDRKRSLSIGVDDRGQLGYWCFTCKDNVKTRAALIKAGIDPGCLPMSGAARKELADRITEIVTADLGLAAKVLAVGALVIEGGEMPRGGALESLAARIGVSRREAYRARHALTSTRRPKSLHPNQTACQAPQVRET